MPQVRPPHPSAARTDRLQTGPIVAIGASTGGTEALRILLQTLPPDGPPLLIVQHMPEGFTAPFARRLDGASRLTVREARPGDRPLRGHAFIAPANRHMLLRRSGAGCHIALQDGPPVSRHRPSCDVLFRSVAQAAGHAAIGVIMTGMGDDGALGLRAMRDAGASTLGQDEASCDVFGMPRAAQHLGAVERMLPLAELGAAILRLATRSV
ncbi:MAG: CheB methylesterase domain-containing protein [Rhodobacteraceae bacterium]|nr:CheB methylesterase domain-containing protein [Paracoccaceae bacterium]